MPNTHTTLTSLFSDIADAIRAKTGDSAAIIADNFPAAIQAIGTDIPANVELYSGSGYYSSLEDELSISISTGYDLPPSFVLLIVQISTDNVFVQIGTSTIYSIDQLNASVTYTLDHYDYVFEYVITGLQDESQYMPYQAYFIY